MPLIEDWIKANAELKMLEAKKRDLDKSIAASFHHQAGSVAMINGAPAVVKYLWARDQDGKPVIDIHFEFFPELDSDKDFSSRSTTIREDKPITWLEPLSEKEMERLQELNELFNSEYQEIDSNSERIALEEERQKLIKRCGHKWKDTSPIFQNWRRQHCEHCLVELSTY